LVAAVAPHISVELLFPEVCSCFGHRCLLAVFVPMPEASMNKDCDTMARQYDVWRARKIPSLHAKTKTQAV
jgi:hypothetical protein